jgi:ankyrin repeat protein
MDDKKLNDKKLDTDNRKTLIPWQQAQTFIKQIANCNIAGLENVLKTHSPNLKIQIVPPAPNSSPNICTLLSIVAQQQGVSEVKFLLDQKADVNFCDDDTTPTLISLITMSAHLRSVKVFGYQKKVDQILKNFIYLRNLPNYNPAIPGLDGQNVLLLACDQDRRHAPYIEDFFSELVIPRSKEAKPAPLDKKNTRTNSFPLWAAMRRCNAIFCQALVQARANVNACFVGQNTTLHGALYALRDLKPGEDESAKQLIKIIKILSNAPKVDLRAKNSNGFTTLHLLFVLHADRPFDQLMEITKTLIDAKADISQTTASNLSPLEVAISATRRPDLVQLLINCGASVSQRKTHNNASPAHYIGNLEILKLLVAKNAKLDAQDDLGFRPLHLVCERNNAPEVEYLLQLFPELVNDEIKEGHTPLSIAVNTIAVLRESWDRLRHDYQFKLPITKKRLLDLMQKSSLAIYRPAFIDVFSAFNSDDTFKSLDELEKVLQRRRSSLQQIIALLLKYNANPNLSRAAELGITPPLQLAICGDNLVSTKLLVEAKADLNFAVISSSQSSSTVYPPLIYAFFRNNRAIINYLYEVFDRSFSNVTEFPYYPMFLAWNSTTASPSLEQRKILLLYYRAFIRADKSGKAAKLMQEEFEYFFPDDPELSTQTQAELSKPKAIPLQSSSSSSSSSAPSHSSSGLTFFTHESNDNKPLNIRAYFRSVGYNDEEIISMVKIHRTKKETEKSKPTTTASVSQISKPVSWLQGILKSDMSCVIPIERDNNASSSSNDSSLPWYLYKNPDFSFDIDQLSRISFCRSTNEPGIKRLEGEPYWAKINFAEHSELNPDKEICFSHEIKTIDSSKRIFCISIEHLIIPCFRGDSHGYRAKNQLSSHPTVTITLPGTTVDLDNVNNISSGY